MRLGRSPALLVLVWHTQAYVLMLRIRTKLTLQKLCSGLVRRDDDVLDSKCGSALLHLDAL